MRRYISRLRCTDDFYWLSAGYGSGKFMLSLDAIQFLLRQHGDKTLPFLAVPENTRQRTYFYKTLGRLMFIGDYEQNLPIYLRPVTMVIAQLKNALSNRQDAVGAAIIGVCRDLRGIFSAALNQRSYNALFDILYQDFLPVLTAVPQTWSDKPKVMIPLLKFFIELVTNRGQRIKFPSSSANGILLFREVSKVVVSYTRQFLPTFFQRTRVESEEYPKWYKSMSLVLNLMAQALQGSYVNFGVFELYKDSALSDSLGASLQVLLSMPLVDVLAYPKVVKAYYAFLNTLFKYHLNTIVKVDTNTFVRILKTLQEGLSSGSQTDILSHCAQSVDHLASFHFSMSKRRKPEASALQAHFAKCPGIFSIFFNQIISIVMFRSLNSVWTLSRPLLSLTLASPEVSPSSLLRS